MGDAAEIGNSVNSLLDVLRQLRGPDGCPWDKKQTHLSLLKYLLEETEELKMEIESGNLGETFKDELADILLQVCMHAIISEEDNRFDFVDIVDHLKDKIIFRHPHVFGENPKIVSEEELSKIWDERKKLEKKSNPSK